MTPLDYAATAIRPAYDTLPEAVRRRIAAELGGEPVAVVPAGGGFTTGFAARIRAASGAERFVKAAGPLTPEVREAYRMEARTNTVLPQGIPAPRMRFQAEVADWTVVGFEAVDGGPVTLPMRPETLDLMLRAWAEAVEALNPPTTEVTAHGPKVKTAEKFTWFQDVAAGELAPFALPQRLHGRWEELAELERGLGRIFATEQITHGDLRPDNMIAGADRAWVCDWNRLRYMPPWIDTVNLLTVAQGDGHDADRLFWAHPTARKVAEEELDTALAAITGALLQAWPEAPQRTVSPAIKDHMRWAGAATAEWLGRRRGW